LLKLELVRKSFRGAVVVEDASFAASAGGILALIGPNGAGKSTTFRMICGLIHPDSGALTWSGNPISLLSKERLGFLPEERGLYQDITVERLLIYWARLRSMRSDAIRHAVELWMDRLEIAPYRDVLVSTLSKGNQQKIQLAICLLHSPDLLVFDEPFSGLDPANQDLVTNLLLEQADRGAVVVISAHQLALVERLATDVVLMNKGLTSALEGFGRSRQLPPTASDRTVVVYLKGRHTPEFADIAKHSAKRDHLGRLVLTFPASGLKELASALTIICSCDEVLDIELDRPGLHQAYLKSVSNYQSGINHGS